MKIYTIQKAFALFAGIFFLTATSGWGQETIIDEPIEPGVAPSGWSYNDISWETADNGYARFDDLTSWLETPIIDLTGYTNVELTFEVAKWGSGGDGPLTVEISDDGGATWEAQTFDSPTPESSTYLTSGPTAITVTGDEVVIRWIREDSPSRKRLRNIVLTGELETQVTTPTFDPNGGTFYDPVDVTIETTTPDATIYYSTGSETGPWTEYTDPVTIEETTTLWAYAEADGLDDSNVADADFTFPEFTEVATIEELQDIAEIGELYRITGEVFMTYQNDSRNQKYFQDNLTGGRGIKIDDDPGYLTTELEIGDGVIDLLGTINVLNRMIRFRPIEGQSPEAAHSTGNTLTPLPVTLAEMIDENNIITVAGQEISVFQSLLIEIEDLQFEQEGDFDSGTNFGVVPISDPTASLEDIGNSDYGVVFRVEYADLDYNGEPIPQAPLTLTAIADQRFEDARIFARDWDDFEIEDPILFASPSSLDGFTYEEGEGPSEKQQFTVSGQNLIDDITITAPENYEISETSGSGYTDEIVLSPTDGEVTETDIFCHS